MEKKPKQKENALKIHGTLDDVLNLSIPENEKEEAPKVDKDS